MVDNSEQKPNVPVGRIVDAVFGDELQKGVSEMIQAKLSSMSDEELNRLCPLSKKDKKFLDDIYKDHLNKSAGEPPKHRGR